VSLPAGMLRSTTLWIFLLQARARLHATALINPSSCALVNQSTNLSSMKMKINTSYANSGVSKSSIFQQTYCTMRIFGSQTSLYNNIRASPTYLDLYLPTYLQLPGTTTFFKTRTRFLASRTSPTSKDWWWSYAILLLRELRKSVCLW
jgi:hypothetical protein